MQNAKGGLVEANSLGNNPVEKRLLMTDSIDPSSRGEDLPAMDKRRGLLSAGLKILTKCITVDCLALIARAGRNTVLLISL